MELPGVHGSKSALTMWGGVGWGTWPLTQERVNSTCQPDIVHYSKKQREREEGERWGNGSENELETEAKEKKVGKQKSVTGCTKWSERGEEGVWVGGASAVGERHKGGGRSSKGRRRDGGDKQDWWCYLEIWQVLWEWGSSVVKCQVEWCESSWPGPGGRQVNRQTDR